MKGVKIFIGLYCAVCLITGCAVPLGEDYTLTRDGDGGDGITYITNYNLPDYVPIPAPGERPVNLLNRGDMDVVVEWKIWKDETEIDPPTPFETFLDNTVYKAVIRLTAKSGYAFSDTPFRYPPGKISSQLDDGGDSPRTVMVTYNDSHDADITFITDYNLQHYIPVPMYGERPVLMINTRADMSVQVLQWYVEEPKNSDRYIEIIDPEIFVFDLGSRYRADIRLKTTQDYRFIQGRDFTYTEGTTNINYIPDADPDVRRVSVTYVPTRIPVPISDFNLTPYIPKPVNGVTPVWSFAGVQYAGTVIWKNTETQTFLTGPFQAGTAYTAELSLSPASGYTMSGIGSSFFEHTGAESVVRSADSNVVTIKFPLSPGVGSPTIVYDTILTEYLPKPVNGVTPVMNIASTQYSGTVAWTPPHSTFQLGTPYTAVLTLNPVSGFTFAGIGQNVFSHGDAPNGVANPSSSGTVTIYFPEARPPSNPTITFGPANTENSALKLLKDRNSDNDQTLIDLSSGTESVPYSAVLVAGDTSPARVILDGHGRILNKTSSGTLITINGGVTLTLQNITLQGFADNDAPLITVRTGGKLILGTGAVITGNETSSEAGGIWVNGGELIINNGAVIKRNRARRGGGLLVSANGRVLMDNGTIGGSSGNDANSVSGALYAGGGVCMDSGVFDMYGGAIQSNHANFEQSAGGVIIGGGTFEHHGGFIKGNTGAARYSGGGVAVHRGGAFTMNGAAAYIADNLVQGEYSAGGLLCFSTTHNGQAIFDLYAGTITNNTADGLHSGGAVYVGGWTPGLSIEEPYVSMYGGTITNNNAGAVYSSGAVYCGVRGSFDMRGGTIMNNNAGAANSGGAVYCESNESFDMSGAVSVIKNNYAHSEHSGGAVYCGPEGHFHLEGGGTIMDNEASAPNSGGAVYIVGEAGKMGDFRIYDGVIQNNTAWGYYSGGAVRIESYGSLDMRDGSIKGNKALSQAAGYNSAGAVYMTGNGEFSLSGVIGGTASADANFAVIGANGVYAIDDTELRLANSSSSSARITGNTGYNNYGVYITSNHFWISGNSVITQDNRVFLGDGVMIDMYGLNIDGSEPVVNLVFQNPKKYNDYQAGATKVLMADGYENDAQGIITGIIDSIKDVFLYEGRPLVIQVSSQSEREPTETANHYYHYGFYNGVE
jgi:hypothetical protein